MQSPDTAAETRTRAAGEGSFPFNRLRSRDGEDSFLRGESSVSFEFLRPTSSESVWDNDAFLTELEWQAEQAQLSESCSEADSAQAANPTQLHLRNQAESNPTHQQNGSNSALVSALALPPTVHTTADTVFASFEGSEPHMSKNVEPTSKNLRSLVPHVLKFTQRPYDFLDRRIEHNKRKLVKQTIGVVFHSSAPLQILLHRPWAAAIVLLIAALHTFFAINAGIEKRLPLQGTAFRLTPLELKSGVTDIAPNAAGFAVFSHERMDTGCLVPATPARSYREGQHLVTLFDETTVLDGFTITTGGPVAHDPIRFSVSVQREDEGWEVVAYQQNRDTFAGDRRPGAAVTLPDFRGEASLFDLRTARDWPWFLGRVGGGIAVGMGLAAAGATGLLGHFRVFGSLMLFLCWGVGSVAMLIAGCCLGAAGSMREAGMWLVYGIVFGTGTAALWCREQNLVPILLWFGLGIVAADLVGHGALVGSSAADVRVDPSHAVLAGCMLLSWAWLWLLSQIKHRGVTRVLAADKAAYEAAWRELCSQPGTQDQLSRLERVAASAGMPRPDAHSAQCQRIKVLNGRGTGADGHAEGSVAKQWVWWLRNAWSTLVFDTPYQSENMEPLCSLDLIYAQATCLHPILRGKVQEWAGKTGGMFATCDGEFVRWDQVRGSVEQRRRVKWGQLKKESRAVEKVIRCYGEDVSRLVDVCRQSIVFATVGELADCLEEMGKDKGVEVVRIKNRLRVEEDGAASAGFRNVSVNLRVVEEDARNLGVDSHVSELQLLLKDFAALQGGEGRHERYLLHRDYHRPQPSASCAAWLLDVIAGRENSQRLEEAGSGLWFGRVRSAESEAASNEYGSTGRSVLQRQALTDLSSISLSSAQYTNRVNSHFSQERPARHMRRRTDGGLLGACAVRDELLDSFRQLLVRRNTLSSGTKGQMLNFWDAMGSVSAFSALFIQSPVQGAMTKRIWQVLMLILSVVGMTMTMTHLYFYFSIWHTFPTFRFTAVGMRGNTTAAPSTHGLGSFGVATGSCPVHDRVVLVEEDGPTMTVHYARPVTMNSFWMRTPTAPNSTDLDPMRFLVHGSHDGEEWTLVGGSHLVLPNFAGYQWMALPYPTPTARDALIRIPRINGVDERRRTGSALQWQTVNFTFLACGAAAVRAIFFRNLNNVAVYSGGFLMTFVTFLLMGVWHLLSAESSGNNPVLQADLRNLGRHSVLFSFIFGIIGLGVLVCQRYFAYFGTAALVYAFGVQMLQIYHFDKMPAPLPTDPIVWTVSGILVVFILAILVRVHILRFARRVVAGDKKQYDVLWAGIASAQREQLERLAKLCASVCSASDSEERALRQCYSPAGIAGINAQAGRSQGHAARTQKRAPVPIMDIRQIYAHATCAHPILLGKVQEWAGKTGGMFATCDGEFVRWDQVRGSVEQRRRVKWGQLKKESRAVEKVIRCYGEDVSRLVDVCRQSIVFATVGELADCLEEMGKDKGVEVVRIKNRLRVEEDGAASAGFRNVSVNLRVVEEDARNLGVDSHVSELQLLLKDFAALQKAEGHKRYVQFRNARGE